MRLTRRGSGAYRYESAYATYNIWKFTSDYGDTQWGCDIFYLDGRSLPHDYMQADTLGDMRHFIAGMEVTA